MSRQPPRTSLFDHRIETRKGNASLADIAQRTAHLMISIKNRAFDTALIDHFCHLVTQYFAAGLVTIVDSPYIHNITAETSDPAEVARRTTTLAMLSQERSRNVQRRIRHNGATGLNFLPWAELAAQTPAWITAEVLAAYNRRGAFHAAVAEQTRKIRGARAFVMPEENDAFLLEEIPPLIWAYYGLAGGVADFYPGPQMPLFWDIDRGRMAAELPRISALAAGHPGHVYVELIRRTASSGDGAVARIETP